MGWQELGPTWRNRWTVYLVSNPFRPSLPLSLSLLPPSLAWSQKHPRPCTSTPSFFLVLLQAQSNRMRQIQSETMSQNKPVLLSCPSYMFSSWWQNAIARRWLYILTIRGIFHHTIYNNHNYVMCGFVWDLPPQDYKALCEKRPRVFQHFITIAWYLSIINVCI